MADLKDRLRAAEPVIERLGSGGLRVLRDLRESGCSDEESARLLSEREWLAGLDQDADLEGFHRWLQGSAPPDVWARILWLVDRGHALADAIGAVRAHPEVVRGLMARGNYGRMFRMVRDWLERDRLPDDERRRRAREYQRVGPQGRLATLIRERIEQAERDDAKAEMARREARD